MDKIKTLVYLIGIFIFLYAGCVMNDFVLKIIGGIGLIVLAIRTVLPEKHG